MFSDYYSLRSTIDFMRGWIQRIEEAAGTKPAGPETAALAAVVMAAEAVVADPGRPGASAVSGAVVMPGGASTLKPNASETT